VTKYWPKRRCNMSRHERDIRLRHMLDHASEAVAMVQGKTRSDLDTDRQLNLSLVRLLEIDYFQVLRTKMGLPGVV